VVEMDVAGNLKVSRRKSSEKIDGIVAMAVARWMAQPAEAEFDFRSFEAVRSVLRCERHAELGGRTRVTMAKWLSRRIPVGKGGDVLRLSEDDQRKASYLRQMGEVHRLVVIGYPTMSRDISSRVV
jgi:hypothetical protein